MCVGGGGGGGAKAKPVYSTKQTDEAMQEGIFENAVMNQNRDKMKAGSGIDTSNLPKRPDKEWLGWQSDPKFSGGWINPDGSKGGGSGKQSDKTFGG